MGQVVSVSLGRCNCTLPALGGDLSCVKPAGHEGKHGTLGGATAAWSAKAFPAVSWDTSEADGLNAAIAETAEHFESQSRAMARLEVLGGGFISKLLAQAEAASVKAPAVVGSRHQRRAGVKPGRGRR